MQSVPVDLHSTAPAKISGQRAIVWVLFLFSGVCGLIYEVLWCRHLGLLFGNTVESMSAVLTAFMSGLALGSYVGGRVCDRLKRPMMVYGILEILIGLYCALLPWALGPESPILPLYRSLYGEAGGGTGLSIARFVISFVLLLIPTTFMGATLPILSQYLVRSKAFIGKTVGALYAINTFGAVVGAAMTGFLFLPLLGKASSNHIAVVANLVLGTLAVIFGMNQVVSTPTEEAPTPQPLGEGGSGFGSPPVATGVGASGGNEQAPVSAAALKFAVLTFGITGFAALATQICWTRAISLAAGSSTYVFSLIVAVFILGLSFGGVWGARAAERTRDPLALLGKVLIAIGLGNMALTAVLGLGPQFFFFLLVFGSDRGWFWQVLFQALGMAILIIGPTFLMGATMPLTLQAAARSSGSAGRTVGTIYAVNTIGSILGSFFGGLVLQPMLGLQYTLQLMSVLYAAPGIILFFMSRSGKLRQPRSDFMIVILGVATTLGVLFFAPRWNPKVMSSGMYLLRNRRTLEAARNFELAPLFAEDPDQKLIYYNEGVSATVAVAELKTPQEQSVLSLSVGGKPDATSHGDMSTQLGLTLVPMIIHERGPESVLVIGLGSGASAGAALTPKSIKQVDVVEMSPEVVEASYYFAKYTNLKYSPRAGTNQFWLDTPNLKLIINDGRNHLLLTSKKYDVIASEPSNPWLAGIGNLFTKEAFQLSREHLNKGGVMCQWIHRYSLKESDFFNIVHTFAEVFPQVQLWCVNRNDFLLIGTEDPVRLPLDTLRARLTDPGLAPMLQRIHFDTEEEFLACFMSADAELRALSAKSLLHTDDNMLLEFSAPKSLYNQQEGLQTTQFESDPELIIELGGLKTVEKGGRADTEQRLDFAVAAREHTRCAFEVKQKRDHWFAASILAPYQLWVVEQKDDVQAAARHQLSLNVSAERNEPFEKADALAEKGQINEAMSVLQEAAAESKKRGETNNYAPGVKAVEILLRAGMIQEARATVQNMIQDPETSTSPKAAKLRSVMAKMMLQAPQPDVAAALKIAKLARTLAEKEEAAAYDATELADGLEALHEIGAADETKVGSEAKKEAILQARASWKLRAVELVPAQEQRQKFARGRADRELALGSLGELLLVVKKYGQAYDEFHDLCSTHGLNVDYRLGLADALLGLAADPDLLKSHPEVALKKLHHARRVCREAFKLKSDEAGAAARLARVHLRLAMLDASAAAFHRAEANAAWNQVRNLDKYGLLNAIDTLQPEDKIVHDKPSPRRPLWLKTAEFFKMDPVELKELKQEIK